MKSSQVSNTTVQFAYNNYRKGGKQSSITVSGVEFLRRFSQHILPAGFVLIRHYGILASRNKSIQLNAAKVALKQPKWEKLEVKWEDIAIEIIGKPLNQCPACKKATLLTIYAILPERGPPLTTQIRPNKNSYL